MERAGRVIAKLGTAHRGLTDEETAIAAWPVAVGKRLALRTSAISLVRSRLVIEVEDTVWQRQLFGLRGQILCQIEKVIGRSVVQELEFRLAVPRRKPVRAESLNALADEADAIRDPLMRSIYKAARRKASA